MELEVGEVEQVKEWLERFDRAAKLRQAGMWPGYRSTKELFSEGLNPYLHCLQQSGWVDDADRDAMEVLTKGRIGVMESLFNPSEGSWVQRDRFVADFSYAIPNKKALELLASFGPIVEMGAGNGYWGWCLKQLGSPVRLYDNYSWHMPWTTWWKRPRRGGPSILRKYGPGWTLFLCWPLDEYPAESVRAFKGHRVAYIGENEPGLCAGEDFFEALEELGYKGTQAVKLPHWSGLRDNLFIYER